MARVYSSTFFCCPTPTISRCYSNAAGARHQFPAPLLRLGRGTTRQRSILRCQGCGGNPRFPSGENDSKAVLDAFFLGKAVAETLNERMSFAVGEVLSVYGQWQAEQQKQVQDFQEEVLERAKRAKEKAAAESMDERGITSKTLIDPPLNDSPGPPSISTNQNSVDKIPDE